MPQDTSYALIKPPIIRLSFNPDELPHTFDLAPRSPDVVNLEFVKHLTETPRANWPAGRILMRDLPSERQQDLAERLLITELTWLTSVTWPAEVWPDVYPQLIGYLRLILPKLKNARHQLLVVQIMANLTDASLRHEPLAESPHHEFILGQTELYAETEPVNWPLAGGQVFKDLFPKPEEPLLALQESMTLVSLSRHLHGVVIPAEVRPKFSEQLSAELGMIKHYVTDLNQTLIGRICDWLTRYHSNSLRSPPI